MDFPLQWVPLYKGFPFIRDGPLEGILLVCIVPCPASWVLYDTPYISVPATPLGSDHCRRLEHAAVKRPHPGLSNMVHLVGMKAR